MPEERARSTKVLNAVGVGTNVSGSIYCGGAKRIGLQFRRGSDAGGSSVFSVKGSMEPEDTVTPTMTTINMVVDNLTNTNGQQETRVASKTISAANGDALLWLDDEVCLTWISVTAVVSADGNASAFILLEY